MTSSNRTILVYAKPPIMGLAKTRLATSLGAATAQRIARWSFAQTLRACEDSRWKTILATTPDTYLTASLGGLWPARLERISQGKGDLTARLNRGLRTAPLGPVLFIGADCPDISNALLADAFTKLTRSDAVFGPARDGGFWLFGLNKTHRTQSPFKNVRWSSKYALGDVRDNLFGSHKIAYLPELVDIDTADDWRDWKAADASPNVPCADLSPATSDHNVSLPDPVTSRRRGLFRRKGAER